MMLTVLTTARPNLESLSTWLKFQNQCCTWLEGCKLKKMSTSTFIVSFITPSIRTSQNFLLYRYSTLRNFIEIYCASRCNMLGEAYFSVPFPIFGPNPVGELELASMLRVTYSVSVRTVCIVPSVFFTTYQRQLAIGCLCASHLA